MKTHRFKKQLFTIYIPIYDAKVHFAIGVSHDELRKRFPDVQNLEEHLCVEQHCARTILFQNGEQLVVFNEFSNQVGHMTLLSHECLHVTIAILRIAGLTLDESSEEAYTYLLQHILSEFMNNVKTV